MKNFKIYHSNFSDSENCNFQKQMDPIPYPTTTSNILRNYLRTIYKNKSLEKKAGNMIMSCNAFIADSTDTIRVADFSFIFTDKHSSTIFCKVIGVCNALINGDAKIGHVAKAAILGGTGIFENARGIMTQKILSENLREIDFIFN